MLHATAKWWRPETSTGKQARPDGARVVQPHNDMSAQKRWTLRYDPSGDYGHGTKFSDKDVKYMRKFGTLDEGAVYERDGVSFVVRGGDLVKQ